MRRRGAVTAAIGTALLAGGALAAERPTKNDLERARGILDETCQRGDADACRLAGQLPKG
jgi:hypothetical protein